MSNKWRRFEALLPLQFNDGRDVPPDWLAEAVLEIVDHFGAAKRNATTGRPLAFQRDPVSRQSRGWWWDVPDAVKNRR
jgi:hypothetical protein